MRKGRRDQEESGTAERDGHSGPRQDQWLSRPQSKAACASGRGCFHAERACALQGAGKDPTLLHCAEMARLQGKGAGRTRVYSVIPGLMGVGLLESISVSQGQKT